MRRWGTKLEIIRERWAGGESGQPRIVIFGCQRSAGVAWQEVKSSKFKVQSDVEFISMPCAGKVEPDYLLGALTMGAEGIMALACPEENCCSIHGNTYARERIREARNYMEEAGIQSGKNTF